MYYRPDNALELISFLENRISEAITKIESLPHKDKNKSKIFVSFLNNVNEFLAGWCGIVPQNFMFNLSRGYYSESSKGKSKEKFRALKMEYWDKTKPESIFILSLHSELCTFLSFIELMENRYDEADIEWFTFLLERIMAFRFMVASHDLPAIRINRDYSISYKGQKLPVNFAQRKAFELIEKGGFDGVGTSQILTQVGADYARVSKIFLSSKAGKLLWQYIEIPKKGWYRLKAIPQKSRGIIQIT